MGPAVRPQRAAVAGEEALNTTTTALTTVRFVWARSAIKNDPNRAIGLPGKSYVQIPTSNEFSLSRGLTVEAWMRPDRLDFPGETDDPYVHWLGKGEKGRFQWGFRFYSKRRRDGKVSSRPNRISAYAWNADGGLGERRVFEEPLTVGQWIHVVAVYEPPGKGLACKSTATACSRRGRPARGHSIRRSALSRFPVTLPCGWESDLQSFLIGGLDEVAILSRVLTPHEIRGNYCGYQR